MIKRGAFIVFEGLDRSGKTTQTKALLNAFERHKIKARCMNFPDRETKIGKLLDAYLSNKSDVDDHAVHLLFSANRWEKAEEIKNALNDGITLIVDRYAYSGVAFSAMKGLDFDWCKGPDTGLPAPDLVVFLELPLEHASARGDYGNERFEKIEIQKKVLEQYNKLRTTKWAVIDASKTREEIHEEIFKVTTKVIQECQNRPIGTLWDQ